MVSTSIIPKTHLVCSFLFAETFKYLYLLFSPPEMISLDKFVFTTEAHPLLRRPWTDTFIDYKA